VPFVVTGISQDGNTAALEASIKAAGLSLNAFEVIGPEDADTPVAGGIAGSGIITGGGLETGTGVPGLTGSAAPGVGGAHMVELGGSLWDRLADLAIPDDEVENYAEALEAGHSIVAYHGTSKSVPQLENLFASNGLSKIKTF
jgi:hypothetical protein